jgi:hypothetical protein
MKIHELLSEAPLPDDWDKSAYKSNTSFASRVRYAKERAKRIGGGSSRVAFEIEYEGRPTILKIAMNKKGLAQNDYESSILNDYTLTIAIPMIDYDEENDPPTWIHTEKAEKMKPTQFKKFFNGLTPDEMMHVVRFMTGKEGIKVSSEVEERYNEIYEDNETISELVSVIGNYDISPHEFSMLSNWGIYKGEPVLIDVGGSSQVISQHYSPKQRY